MKQLKSITVVIMLLFLSSCASLDALLSSFSSSENGFSNTEAVRALKEALRIGVRYAADDLHKEDGYYGNDLLKIMFPPEASVIIENIDRIPGGKKLLKDVVLRVNRSAENAAKEIVPIFTNAIKDMSIQDGINIVYGSNTAASEYLKEKCYKDLQDLFQPKLEACLKKPLVMGVSADKAWRRLVNAYNKAGKYVNIGARIMHEPAPMPHVSPDMSRFATEKALDGVFYKIGEEEAKIRKDPFEYASNIIQKVFGIALKNK